MKRLFISITLLLSSIFSVYAVDYEAYLNTITTDIQNKKSEIQQIKQSIKLDKNNVVLHKTYVIKNTELEHLLLVKKKIKDANKLYKALVKQNKVLDNEKIKLLQIKQNSLDADIEVEQLMKNR